MKNKLCYVLVGLLISFSFVNNVFADEFSYELKATANKDVVTKGEEATIMLSLKSDSPVGACTFNITSDDTLEKVSFKGANSWVLSEGAKNVSIDTAISANPLTTPVAVMELKYIVNGDGKITISQISCIETINEERQNHSDVVVDLMTQEIDEDTSLKNIVVTGGTTPEFSSDKLNYLVKLNSSTFGLTITANNPEYQDDIVVKDDNGKEYTDWNNIKFDNSSGNSSMALYIIVNNKTTYGLAFVYEVTGLDNSLATLTIDGKDIGLKDGEYEYSYTVSKDTTSFELGATLKDSTNFEFSPAGNEPGNFGMSSDGETHISLTIVPKDSSLGAGTVSYSIVVKREGGSANNNGGSTQPSTKPSGGNNVGSNPNTGDISVFIMLVILLSSFVGSVLLYKKNLESYK